MISLLLWFYQTTQWNSSKDFVRTLFVIKAPIQFIIFAYLRCVEFRQPKQYLYSKMAVMAFRNAYILKVENSSGEKY